MKRVSVLLSAFVLSATMLAPQPAQAKIRKPVRPAVKAAMVGAIQMAPPPARPAYRPAFEARLAKEARKPQRVTAASPQATGGVWDALAECESNGRWSYNGGSGFDGGLQFHPGTWSAYAPQGYPAYAWQATREQQIEVAKLVLASQGWGAWPACSRKLGLR